MANIPITIACGDYDRTRAIKDGIVPVEGCDVTYVALEPEELFFRTARYHEFDVSEFSFASYMMLRARGVSHYLGIPVFPSRVFRHSSLFIRTDRGIKGPEDLKGKLVGVPEYQITAVVWVRGMFEEEYGVKPSDIRWRTGGLEQPGREERTPLNLKTPIDLEPIGPDKTLSAMLEAGELDALVVARSPSCFDRGAPNIARLFPDYRQAEQAYFEKTGLFPIMHLLTLRQSLADQYPWLPGSLHKAFVKAKALAYTDLERSVALGIALPWVAAELAATRAVMGEDFWPYGAAANATALDALTRYAFDQELVDRKLTNEELFAPSTLEMVKI